NAGTAATSGSAGWDRGSWSRRSSFAGSRDTNRFRRSSKNWKLWHRLSRGLSNGERRRRVGYAGAATFNGVPGILQRLGGDRNLVGKKVQFDREVFTVVGIMPRGFASPADAEMWFPILINDPRNIEIGHSFRVIARLKDGATPAVAQREMQTIAARLKRAYPQDKEGIGANVVPLLEQTVGEARRALLVLMGAVGCVLLIAGANVANLLLVRTTSRRRELALRLSLGAGRWRIARCLLSESVLL